MKRLTMTLLTALLLLTGSGRAAAATFDYESDPVHQHLYQRFLQLYNLPSKMSEFYETCDSLLHYYREKDLKMQYYKMQLNVCLFDTEYGNLSRAMKRTNQMLEEMEDEGYDAYSQVYTALGTIYESRGNLRMARHYYEEAVNNLLPEDKGTKMGTYSRIAAMLMLREPVEAELWNEKYYEESLTFDPYHQVYLFIKAMISFAVNDEFEFNRNYQNYQNFHSQHKGIDNYGMETIETAHLAMQKNYDEALARLTPSSPRDISLMALFDMRTLIYKKMERYDLALTTEKQRSEYADSLNSDILFDNLNEINAAAGVSSARVKAAQEREKMLTIVLVLAVIIIAILGLGLMYFRRNRTQLKEKNDQLRSALSMAEEGQKMKTEFVRSVSHEIRTPLNAINGFNDVLNTPGIDLTPEEREDLLNRIAVNIKAITDIVDDMLRVADKESNDFYPKTGTIYCNQFFSGILYEHRDRVSSHIELNYTTKVINRFQLETNTEGLRKILDQVIHNAIKFTKEGHILMHCEQSADGKRVLVSIEDTGCGIPKDQQDQVFEGFYKGDVFEQGIGLGLTVSKKIARKLGGDLVLDTEYTQGARFVLSLPID